MEIPKNPNSSNHSKHDQIHLVRPKKIDISVVVPITEYHDDIEQLYLQFSAELQRLDQSSEFLFVIDAGFNEAYQKLLSLKQNHPCIKIILFCIATFTT